jgi:hypothetical protein
MLMKQRPKGWHLASEQELVYDHFDLEVAFRRDPDGLCRAVAKALNDLLITDPHVNGWQWSIDWTNLPGAISVAVTGTACDQEAFDCPAFFAATSVSTYEEIDAAAARLQERIHRTLAAWTRK